MASFKDKPKKHFKTRKVFRTWLSKNWDKSDGIWVIIHKKNSPTQSVTYPEVVQECLCFGWIDSLPNKNDEFSYFQYICPRKAGSPWSRINKNYIKELEKKELIAEPGKKLIEQAKKDGSWELYDDIEALIIPDDLQQALKKAKVEEAFAQISDSTKKGMLWNLKSAKSEETRKRRVEKIVTDLSVAKRH